MNDLEQLEQELHTAEIDLKKLQYINGDKECQDDILKLKGRIELLKEWKEKKEIETNQEYVIRTTNDWKKKSAQDLDKFLQEKIESAPFNMIYLYDTSKFGLDEDLNLAINQETDEFNEELEIVKKWLLTVSDETLSELEKGNLYFWEELDSEMYRIEFFHQLHYNKDNTLDEITMQGEFHEEADIVKEWIKEWKGE